MDALYLSERILISSDTCNKMVSGGILVSFDTGTIKRIFTTQEEINSWMFMDHGGDVRCDFPLRARVFHSLDNDFRFMILRRK